MLAFIIVLTPALVLAADYVGSQKCAKCHQDIYDRWKDSLHNKPQQELTPTNDRVVSDWKGTLKLKGGNIPEFTVKLSRKNGEYFATLVDTLAPLKEATYKVVRTYGGWPRLSEDLRVDTTTPAVIPVPDTGMTTSSSREITQSTM